jgi:hypothetical protein
MSDIPVDVLAMLSPESEGVGFELLTKTTGLKSYVFSAWPFPVSARK